MKVQLTEWQKHRQEWGQGCGAGECARANRVCLARGAVPCDVLFVGEAPGEGENVLGRPFAGPAGQLLDRIVARAIPRIMCSVCGRPQITTPSGVVCGAGHGGADSVSLRLAYTNLVGCVPRDDDGRRVHQPSHEQIEACAQRLQDFLRVAAPRLVVCVGKMPADWLKRGARNPVTVPEDVKQCQITHPSAVLQANVAQKGILIQRMEVTLSNAVEDIWVTPTPGSGA